MEFDVFWDKLMEVESVLMQWDTERSVKNTSRRR